MKTIQKKAHERDDERCHVNLTRPISVVDNSAIARNQTDVRRGAADLIHSQDQESYLTVTKSLAIAFAVLLLLGCANTNSHSEPDRTQELVSGEFKVPQEELPERIVELAKALERIHLNSTQSEFEAALVKAGLNAQPDHFKDFGYFWYLDEDFNSETDPDKRVYRITIGYLPSWASRPVFNYASIHRTDIPDEWMKTLWLVEWPDAFQ